MREGFREYGEAARPGVQALYRANHTRQTLALVQAKKQAFLTLDRKEMGIWEAAELLDSFVDDSDPDTELSQLQHALQTAEAIAADGHPRWLVLTGFLHDFGKVLCLFDEPQWAVVGDTFPVGCRFDEAVVLHDHFSTNADNDDPRYNTALGIYEPGCGLAAVQMSWGHDEYLYHVLADHLPEEALYVIRYHSFYACHRDGAYGHLLDDRDRRLMEWVRTFNPYDLYSKADEPPDVAALRPRYEALVAEFLPDTLRW